jgi:glycerol-3-phosphate O-acyltransferase
MTRSPLRRLVFGTLRRVLYLWVRSETINQSAFTLKLDRSKPVFYVLQQPSLSDLAVVDTECRKAGLPRPVLPVAVGELLEPAAFFYLTPEPDWLGRQDKRGISPTLQRLVSALSQHAVDDAQIIPVSVFWGQSPDRETSPWKLLFADSWAVTGRLRRLVSILILGRKTRVQFSTPIHLRELVEQDKGHERTLRMVQRILRVHFRNQKSAVIGPDVSHRRNLVKGLVHGPQVRQAIIEEAERENISLEKAESQALRYGNEIASDYTYTAIRFLELVLSWFWNKIYDGIKVNHIEGVQEVAQGHEVIYVPCHRSHIDYLLLSYLLFRNGLTPPHIAAGINLNMPVIGGLLRRGGAFFMRRTFKGNPLYTAVFNEYLHTLFSKGFPVEYFVEGGRSRTGRMLQPKTGMLAITMRSFLRSNRLPVVFVPVYIGYERVLEGRTYLGELRGASKKKNRSSTSSRSSAHSSSALAMSGSTSVSRSNWRNSSTASNRTGASRITARSTARPGSMKPPTTSASAWPNTSMKRQRSTRSTWWPWRCSPPASWPWTNAPCRGCSTSTWPCCAACPTRRTPPCRTATARR